jgi:hypothetical protein
MNREGTGLGGRAFVIISVLFVLVVGAVFFALNGGSNKAPTQDSINVTDPRIGRSVKMTVGGPLASNEAFESYSIELSQNQRVVTRMSGYQDVIMQRRTYANNFKAYEQLVYALDRQSFTVSRSVKGKSAEERGACAAGRRYVFEILDNSSDIMRLWTTTCSGSSGTFAADIENVRELFDNQIPDLSSIMRGSKL